MFQMCVFNGVAQPLTDTHRSGQIIATSAEVTLNGGLVREPPQNPLNSGLGIILICPDRYIFIYINKYEYIHIHFKSLCKMKKFLFFSL